ncbi:MAG: hypothetical protein ACYTJ0_11230 [Planctomycetota bacterium]
MASSRCLDTSIERRRAAAATVRRHVRELGSILAADGLRAAIVDGSAVAVELYVEDTNTRCTEVRVAVFVAPGDRRPVERVLARAGFEATAPTADATLLRLAGRRGRRAIHVLFDAAHGSSRRSAARAPSSAEAASARAARLATAWLEPAATFRRVGRGVAAAHDIMESFEVQLIERRARAERPASDRAGNLRSP